MMINPIEFGIYRAMQLMENGQLSSGADICDYITYKIEVVFVCLVNFQLAICLSVLFYRIVNLFKIHSYFHFFGNTICVL